MDRFKNIFKREQLPGNTSQIGSSGSLSSGSGENSENGIRYGDSPVKGSSVPLQNGSSMDTEGFLCPMCMKSFLNPDALQRHFDLVHTESKMSQQMTSDKELELLKMQLTASEESRSLLSTELMNTQKHMQELISQKRSEDMTSEVKRLETNLSLLQIENTELSEKCDIANRTTLEMQEKLNTSTQEKKTLNELLNSEKEKLNMIVEQLNQERSRSNNILEENKRFSELLRKAEVAYEQLKADSVKVEDIKSKLTVKSEQCKNLETQISGYKQTVVRAESEIEHLKTSIGVKDDTLSRLKTTHDEMKTALETKLQSYESLIQEKTTSIERLNTENQLFLHKSSSLEERLKSLQSELTDANRKYDDLHKNFMQKIEAGEGTSEFLSQVKEESARVQEKLKYTEEKLYTEKHESFEKIQKAEMEIENLKSVRSGLEERLLTLQKEMESKIAKMQSDHNETAQSLNKTISSQSEKISSLEAQLEEREVQASSMVETISNYSNQVESQLNHITALTQRCDSLESEKQIVQSQFEECSKDIQSLKETKSSIDVERESLRNELHLLNNQLAESEQKNANLSEELLELQAAFQSQTQDNLAASNAFTEKISTLEGDLKSTDELLKEKLSALDQLMQDYTLLNDQHLALKLTNQENEKTKKTFKSDTERLTAKLLSLEEENKQLVRQLESSRSQHSADVATINELISVQERSKAQMLEKEATILTLQHQIDTQNKESENQLNTILSQMAQKEASFNSNVQEKDSEISKLKEELTAIKSKIKKQSETNSALSKEHSTVVETLKLKEKQMATLEESHSTILKELEDVRRSLDKKTADSNQIVNEMSDIVQRTSDENEVLNRALAELKLEINVLEKRLNSAQETSDDWQSKHRLLSEDYDALKQAFSQERAATEDTKQLFLSQKQEMNSRWETMQEERSKMENTIKDLKKENELSKKKLEDEMFSLQEVLASEKSKAEESDARFNMQIVSLTESLSLNKADLTATQEKLMDVVKHNDELRGLNLELEAKLEASGDDRRMLWDRCLASENETASLRDEVDKLRFQLEQANAALHELGRENQSLQIKTTKALSRKWANDEEVSDCSNCAKNFSVTIRKHHCRSCGNIFCNDCSSKQAPLPASKKPVRVCDNCYVELNR